MVSSMRVVAFTRQIATSESDWWKEVLNDIRKYDVCDDVRVLLVPR